MNSTSIKIKKFLSNRNTVTIICAIIGIIVLYVGYTMKVQSAVEPVSIPYAKVTIQPRTKITEEMIGWMTVANAALEEMGKNVIRNKKDLIDYYTNVNTMIPQGSLFYDKAVVKKDELPDSAVYDVKEGEVLHYLTVNMSTSYVNAIVPGGYIDLYVKTKQSGSELAKAGKFIKNVKVLAVKTSDGLNVFENSDELRIPAYVIFAVTEEQHGYLVSASQINMTIFPVPTSASEKDVIANNSANKITSEEIIEYIEEESERFEQIIEEDNDLVVPPLKEENGGKENEEDNSENGLFPFLPGLDGE